MIMLFFIEREGHHRALHVHTHSPPTRRAPVLRTSARARAPDTPGRRRRARFDTAAAPRAPCVAPASSFLSLSIARSSLHQGSRRSGKVFILLHVFAGVGHVDRHRDEIGRAPV